MRRRLALSLVALAAALAIGCGGDDDGGGDADGAPAQEDNGRLVIEAEEGAFDAHAVYESAAPSVVTITSIFPGGTGLLEEAGRQAGQGSGFVISDDGEIVTNAHVVTDGQAQGSTDVNPARSLFVQFPDQNQVEAEIVGFDPFADVALIKVDPEGLDLDPIELGSNEQAQVGDPVAAIGSPFSQRQSLSVGVVSALNRSIPSLTRFSIDNAIQTDASINPGNSGGPLLDAEGRVIGINQQIDTTTGGNQGVGFAVPIDLAKRSVDQLREDGEVDYSFLGVTTSPLYPQLAERLGVDAEVGAVVVEIVEGSPADEAGLQVGAEEITFQASRYALGSDIIVEADGKRIVAESDLSRIISLSEPGEEIVLTVIRDDGEEEIRVTPAARELDSGAG